MMLKQRQRQMQAGGLQMCLRFVSTRKFDLRHKGAEMKLCNLS